MPRSWCWNARSRACGGHGDRRLTQRDGRSGEVHRAGGGRSDIGSRRGAGRRGQGDGEKGHGGHPHENTRQPATNREGYGFGFNLLHSGPDGIADRVDEQGNFDPDSEIRLVNYLQANTRFYGIEGQGWFLNFHCFTKYVKVAFFRSTSLSPRPPGESKHKDVRYLDIHEGDTLGQSAFGQIWRREKTDRKSTRLNSSHT